MMIKIARNGHLRHALVVGGFLVMAAVLAVSSIGNILPFGSRVNAVDTPSVWDFAYNGTDGHDGSAQTFTAPASGYYELQTWGAGGGYGSTGGARGGYAVGAIYLNQDQTVYVYVGGRGNYTADNATTRLQSGGWNGGGTATHTTSTNTGTGGGATDIRTAAASASDPTVWNDQTSLQSRVIVAGGGGGTAGYWDSALHQPVLAGSGGGINGGAIDVTYTTGNGTNHYQATGGSQTAAGCGATTGPDYQTSSCGAFGVGASDDRSGGGGGWYGGGSTGLTSAGGSGYIGGVRSFGDVTAQTIAGGGTTANIPRPDGGTGFGQQSNGYAQITRILPTVTSISPMQGSVNGGQTVTIQGSGFLQPIEYTQFDGSSYVETGVNQLGDIKVSVDYEFSQADLAQSYSNIFGERCGGGSQCSSSSPNADAYTVGYDQSNNALEFWHNGSGAAKFSSVIPDASRHLILTDNNEVYYDGNLVATSANPASAVPLNLILGGKYDYTQNTANGSDMFNGKIYGFQISKSGNLVQDLIPAARTVDGAVEYGFKDNVTGAWFGNAGAGTLTGSPAATPITVDLGGAQCTNVTVLSDTELTCVTPTHVAGTVDTNVTIGADTLTLPQSYTYLADDQPTPNPTNPTQPLPPNTGLTLDAAQAGGIGLALALVGMVTGLIVVRRQKTITKFGKRR
jgi:hypothetical protein